MSSLEVLLDAVDVDEGEVPVLAVDQRARLSLWMHTRSLDRTSHLPAGARFEEQPPGPYVTAQVTWVGKIDGALTLVVEHEGALVAVLPAYGWFRTRPLWWQRLFRRASFPVFVPLELPVPTVGQVVELEGELVVMSENDCDDWPGPSVAMSYVVHRIDAEVVGPSPVPAGRHWFEPVHFPPRPPITGLRESVPPPGYEDSDPEADSVSSYRLALTPLTR